MANVEILGGAALAARFKEMLESWPLYRMFYYNAGDAQAGFATLPQTHDLYCRNCSKEQKWERDDVTAVGYIKVARYKCRNCDRQFVSFIVSWVATNEWTCVGKIGQNPAQEIEPAAALAKKLPPEDLAFFRKALTCRQFSYGVAALTYLRRVVENQMNAILDLIADAANDAGFAPEELKNLDTAKKSHRFDDKVTYAAAITPRNLKPGGINPIDRLHDLTSEGIHSLPEDECLARFDRCRLAFEHFFTRVHFEKQQAKEYVEAMRSLDVAKTKG